MCASRFDEFFGVMGTPALMQQFGEAVVYWVAGDIPAKVDLTAAVGAEGIQERIAANGDQTVERIRSAVISRDPASPWGGVAEPGVNDQVAIGGVMYEVRSATDKGGNLATLECVRLGTVEKGRPEYRGR